MAFKHFIICICWIACVAHENNGLAQLAYNRYEPEQILGVKNGLSQGFITSILQDKSGLIWMGTKDGLNRWDGYSFRTFRNTPGDSLSLPDNYVTQMVADHSGNLWIGTETRGLAYFDLNTGRFFPFTQYNGLPLPTSYILQMQYTDSMLMVLYQGEMQIYDVHLFERRVQAAQKPGEVQDILQYIKPVYNYNENKPAGFPEVVSFMPRKFHLLPGFQLFTASKDTLYWHDFDKDYTPVNPKKMFLEIRDIKKYDIGAFVYPVKGKRECMVIMPDRIGILNPQSNTWSFVHKFSPEEPLPLIYQGRYNTDAAGNFYFPVNGNFLRFNPFSLGLEYLGFKVRSPEQDLVVRSSFIDADGYLWLGTAGYGVYKYNTNKNLFATLPISGSPIAFNRENDLFFTSNFWLYRSDNNFQKHTKVERDFFVGKNALIWNNQYGWDGNDTIWLTVVNNEHAKRGIYAYRISNGRWTLMNHLVPQGNLKFFNWGLYSNQRGNIWQWYENQDGITELKFTAQSQDGKNKYFEFPSYFRQLGSRTIHAFYEDRFNRVWIASVFGLLSLNTEHGTWKKYPLLQQVFDSSATVKALSIYADPIAQDSLLWIGTEGNGLFSLNTFTGATKQYGIEDGLPNEVVYGILPDKNGNLWLSTNNGLCCFHPQTGMVRLFGEANGTAGQEFNRQQYLLMPGGKMVFGGVMGITSFHPDSLLALPPPAKKVVITNILVDGKPFTQLSDKAKSSLPANMPESVELPYGKGTISVFFTLPYFTSPEQKQFRYKLEGFSNEWIYNENNPMVSFTNLFPKTYLLTVQARATTGDWLDGAATLKIIIMPPWYLTWWFISAAFIAFISMLYGIYRYRLWQETRLLKLRNDIASDLHDEIGSTLSSITVYSDIITQKATDPMMQQIATRVSNASRDLLLAMSDIVWSVNPKNDGFENIIIRMQSLTNELLEAKGIKASFVVAESASQIKLSIIERKNMYLIFKESLNNAIKYSQCSKIEITIQYNGENLHFTFFDNGMGFDVTRPKEGNGLENMRRRAADMGATLTIHTQPGKGTSIHLDFPTQKRNLWQLKF